MHSFFIKNQTEIFLKSFNTINKQNERTVLQSGEVFSHNEILQMVCLRGFEIVGNNLVKCFQGRIIQNVGKCVPSFN